MFDSPEDSSCVGMTKKYVRLILRDYSLIHSSINASDVCPALVFFLPPTAAVRPLIFSSNTEAGSSVGFCSKKCTLFLKTDYCTAYYQIEISIHLKKINPQISLIWGFM